MYLKVLPMAQQLKPFHKGMIVSATLLAVLALATSELVVEEEMLTQNGPESHQSDFAVRVGVHTESLTLTTDNNDSETILAYKSQYGALPDSLQGTLMRQGLQVDEQGNLRISSDIKRVFDYFLSTIEEEELETILARIDEYLSYYLQEPALSQSQQILAQYIELKQALYDFEHSRSESLKELIESGELMADKGRYLTLLQEQLSVQSDLRRQYLEPEINEAFYASEEAYDQYSLARLLVESDESLSVEEKQERLAQIDAQAPRDIIEARKEASITDDLRARTEQVRQNGGGQDEIRSVRVEMFGEEAAERFDALDKERAHWKNRLDGFLVQREEILSMEGLSVEERQAQVDILRESQFDSREQIRVKVYERKADA